jgi:3-dehydroquinate synthetase
VVKIAAIADADLLDSLEGQTQSLLSCDPSVIGPVVARCVALKAQIVSQDVRDRGQRALLNAGHTVGHGLEAALDFQGIRHGEAVSIGLVLEARWAVREGHCADQDFPDRLERLLRRLGLPTTLPNVDRARVTQAMRLDKKRAGDNLALPVPLRSGHYVLIEVGRDGLQEILSP